MALVLTWMVMAMFCLSPGLTEHTTIFIRNLQNTNDVPYTNTPY